MKRNLPDNVTSYIDRHGKERFRWRKTGFKQVALKNRPGTAKRPSAEVKGLNEGGEAPPVQPGADLAIPGSIRDLLSRLYRLPSFIGKSERTRYVRRKRYDRFAVEYGDDLVRNFGFEHIDTILSNATEKRAAVLSNGRKREVGGATAAHILRKDLNRLFSLAVRLKWVKSNPVEEAERVKVPKGGWHTWTEEEIAQYQRRHPLGTKARLAVEIFLWTWQRRGDAHRFGPKHLKGGRIKYQQAKGGKELWLPAAPQLLDAIRAMPSVGIETFLVTEAGKPFSVDGFGNWFRKRCDEAGLPQCSAHGLRKAGARRAADLGSGNQGLKAVGGWSKDDEVAIYTAAADQARLAEATLGLVIDAHLAREKTEAATK